MLPTQHALSTFPPSGLRTEQDLYVRLIDSMSKQVSQPRGARPSQTPISGGVSEHPHPCLHLPSGLAPSVLTPALPSSLEKGNICTKTSS